MCGRYKLSNPKAALLRTRIDPTPLLPRFNVAPTQEVPAVRAGADGGRELAMLRWGLIPFWAKEPSIGARMINARAETVTEKPGFRDAFQKRRCLIPADGFYEWQRREDAKQPYLIRLRGGEPFAFAGLWDRWTNPRQQTVESCAVITTEANELVRPIHDRMPVIVPPEFYDAWLTEKDPAKAREMLRPFTAEAMEAGPVSTRVNNARVDDEACAEPWK